MNRDDPRPRDAAPIRVMVVEDSRTAAAALCRLLAPSFEIVGVAATGAEALRLEEELQPDVITMDIMLPDADGLTLTRTILARRKVAIIVVSSAIDEADATLAFEALGAGAYEVVRKDRFLSPSGDAVNDGTRLVQLVRTAALRRPAQPSPSAEGRGRRDRAVATPAPLPVRPAPPLPLPVRPAAAPAQAPSSGGIIAIGASTGGPAALRNILSTLPARLGVPIVVAQHMADGFTGTLVSWLSSQTHLRVRTAADREIPAPDTVYFAPSAHHLLVSHGRLSVQPRQQEMSCPSVDLLLASVGDWYGGRAVCLVLTGMGADGAEGLLHAAQLGAVTAAQDRQSSAIYGMPAEALRRGGARESLALDDIAAWIARQAALLTREDACQGR